MADVTVPGVMFYRILQMIGCLRRDEGLPCVSSVLGS